MRLSLTLLALIFVLMGACVITSVPQWRPAELTSVKCTKAQAEPIIKACREGAHNGDALQSFPQSDHVICQPQHSGQLCAMVLEFPDKRVFSYVDVTCPQKTGPPKKLVYGVGTEGLQWVAKTSQQSRLSSSYARSRC